MPDVLKVGDDHNLTSNRTVGNPHPQYVRKGEPIVATSGATINCPFTIVDPGVPSTVMEYLCGTELITVRADHVPDYDFLNGQALWYSGLLAFPWKGMYSWMLSTRTVFMSSANQTLSGGTQNNWDITNLGQDQFTIFRVTASAPTNVAGIVPWSSGGYAPLFYLINVGSNTITLVNEGGTSAAGNRIITGTGASLSLVQNDMAHLWYDITTTRWRCLK